MKQKKRKMKRASNNKRNQASSPGNFCDTNLWKRIGLDRGDVACLLLPGEITPPYLPEPKDWA